MKRSGWKAKCSLHKTRCCNAFARAWKRLHLGSLHFLLWNGRIVIYGGSELYLQRNAKDSGELALNRPAIIATDVVLCRPYFCLPSPCPWWAQPSLGVSWMARSAPCPWALCRRLSSTGETAVSSSGALRSPCEDWSGRLFALTPWTSQMNASSIESSAASGALGPESLLGEGMDLTAEFQSWWSDLKLVLLAMRPKRSRMCDAVDFSIYREIVFRQKLVQQRLEGTNRKVCIEIASGLTHPGHRCVIRQHVLWKISIVARILDM